MLFIRTRWKLAKRSLQINTLRDIYDILGSSQPSFCKWQVWGICLAGFWKRGLQMSLSVLRRMIWPDQKRSSWRWRFLVSPLWMPALHPTWLSLWLHQKTTICTCSEKRPRSHQGLSRPLGNVVLCQSLGHLETRVAMPLRFAVQVAHSQNFWLCSGCPPWRPTGNAAASDESSLAIKEL